MRTDANVSGMLKVDWSGDTYADVSALQKWLAEESLASLSIGSQESVLDAGCGDGRITAQIAQNTSGRVVGFDASPHMVSHAVEHHRLPNLSFVEAVAQEYRSSEPFDRLVSFNALHWVPRAELGEVFANLASCLKPGARAHIRLVGLGQLESLESVIETTCLPPEWREFFPDFQTRFCHPTVEEMRGWVEAAGFRVESIEQTLKSWDFEAEEDFRRWADTTFVAWSASVPEARRVAFETEALARYSSPTVFQFYQMVTNLTKIA